MPLAFLEEKMSRVSPQFLDELSAFVDFLLYRQGSVAAGSASYEAPRKRKGFGALKDKITYIAPDFDEPIDDFAEYM